MNLMDDELGALFSEYRAACPDPEGGRDFMPHLWQKIEARRAGSEKMLRRLAQICVMATVALTIVMAVVIPRIQVDPTVDSSYVDVLAAANNTDAIEVLATGDIR